MTMEIYEMRKCLLIPSLVKLTQNTQVIMRTYELFIMQSYMTLAIH